MTLGFPLIYIDDPHCVLRTQQDGNAVTYLDLKAIALRPSPPIYLSDEIPVILMINEAKLMMLTRLSTSNNLSVSTAAPSHQNRGYHQHKQNHSQDGPLLRRGCVDCNMTHNYGWREHCPNDRFQA